MSSDKAASLISKRIPHQTSSDKLFLKSAVRQTNVTFPSCDQSKSVRRFLHLRQSTTFFPLVFAPSSRHNRLHASDPNRPSTYRTQSQTSPLHAPAKKQMRSWSTFTSSDASSGGRENCPRVRFHKKCPVSKKAPIEVCRALEQLLHCIALSTTILAASWSLQLLDLLKQPLGTPLRAPASAVQTCSATMKKNTHATMMVGRCGYDKLCPQKKSSQSDSTRSWSVQQMHLFQHSLRSIHEH